VKNVKITPQYRSYRKSGLRGEICFFLCVDCHAQSMRAPVTELLNICALTSALLHF